MIERRERERGRRDKEKRYLRVIIIPCLESSSAIFASDGKIDAENIFPERKTSQRYNAIWATFYN